MKAHSYHAIDTGGAWAWRALLLSLVITAAIFLLLPLSDFLGGRAEEREVRIVERVGPEAIKPEKKPPDTPQHTSAVAKRSLEKPHLPQARRTVSPMLIPASLALDIGSDTGDFSLNFALTPTTLGEELIFEVSEVDTPPEPLARVAPLYPYTARARGIEGRVELLFVVQPDGSVSDVEVKSSLPRGTFDEAAMDAVKKWRFKPGTKGGRPVATRVLLPLRFEIER
jgi:protein TonB